MGKSINSLLTAEEVAELEASSRYMSCPCCKFARRFWAKLFNCPIWKCDKGRPNCPRIGSECPEFDLKENLKSD